MAAETAPPMPDPLTPEGRLRAVREELAARRRWTYGVSGSLLANRMEGDIAAGHAMADEWERHLNLPSVTPEHEARMKRGECDCSACRLFVVWSDALLGRSG